jgi:hypothetical protein
MKLFNHVIILLMQKLFSYHICQEKGFLFPSPFLTPPQKNFFVKTI